MADRPIPVKDVRLLDVKVGLLPNWSATRDYTPAGFVTGVRGGYDRFVKKYIDVKKAGIGGMAMMLTAYVVFKYIWSFDRIKHDLWRKYQ